MQNLAPPATLPKSNDPCWCGSGRKFKRCHRGAAAAPARPIEAGRLSPTRPVPSEIPRPDYVATGEPQSRPTTLIKTPEQIERMRRAGRAAAEILAETAAAVRPGITTDELDAICHQACIDRGGYPSPLGYHGFPKSLCTSVNEVICHGIPDDRALQDGDIVNLDVTIYLDGVHGDTNATYCVGDVDPASKQLIAVTHECMMNGIEAVRPGGRIHDIGRAIETHAHRFNYGVVRAFVGHGIGEQFHIEPSVPHYFERAANMVMAPGMTFTIEPMITMSGSWRHTLWEDGWTAVTIDKSRTAQFEHTILVTDDGVEILTQQ